MVPTNGGHLVVAVGLMGSKDPADSVFLGSKGEETTQESPSLAFRTRFMGVLQYPGTQFGACL